MQEWAAKKKLGFLEATIRFLRCWDWSKARYEYEISVESIDAAFEMERERLIKRMSGLRDALAQFEAILEEKRARLNKLREYETDLLSKRAGALALAAIARRESEEGEYDKFALSFERFQVAIKELELDRAWLEYEIEESTPELSKVLSKLAAMQAEFERIPRLKAEAIADFVTEEQAAKLRLDDI